MLFPPSVCIEQTPQRLLCPTLLPTDTPIPVMYQIKLATMLRLLTTVAAGEGVGNGTICIPHVHAGSKLRTNIKSGRVQSEGRMAALTPAPVLGRFHEAPDEEPLFLPSDDALPHP